MGVIVVHPQRLGSFTERCDAWVYADDDLEILGRVEAGFPGTAPLVAAADFQSAAASRRASFVAWADANLVGRPIEDWLTTPLHRNTYRSNLFLHAVWADLISTSLAKEPQQLVVVTDSPAMVAALRLVAAEQAVSFAVVGGARFRLGDFGLRLRACAALCAHVLDILVRILLSRFVLGRAHLDRLAGTEILVDTYLHPGDLKADGRYVDRYFPGLVEWYAAQGRKAATYPFLFRARWRGLPAIYRGMRRSAVPMAPFELFAGWLDVFTSAAKCVIGAMRQRSTTSPRCFSVSLEPFMPLLGFTTALYSLYPLVLSVVPRRMADKGLRPRYVIDWFENQPMDRATAWGFKQTGAECEVIAARQYVPYSNALSFFSSREEIRMGVGPQRNWICGPMLQQIFERYDAGATYELVPSFRYAHVHEFSVEGQAEGKSLLVILTHSFAESMSIVALIDQAMDFLHGKVSEIILKPHPILSAAEIRPAIAAKGIFSNAGMPIRWIDDPLAKALPDARLAVTSGSSAAIEALCYGVPVVLVGRQAGLDYVPLETVDRRLWRIAYDRAEFQAAVDWLFPSDDLSSLSRSGISAQVKKDFFVPLRGNMAAFLPDRHQAS